MFLTRHMDILQGVLDYVQNTFTFSFNSYSKDTKNITLIYTVIFTFLI